MVVDGVVIKCSRICNKHKIKARLVSTLPSLDITEWLKLRNSLKLPN